MTVPGSWPEATGRPMLTKAAGVLLIGAAGLLAGCQSASAPAPTAGIPSKLLQEARPIGRGKQFHPPVAGRVIGLCRRRLGARFGVHVEVFGANEVVLIPAGIGTVPPVSMSEGRIVDARCFGSLVTVDPTGLVLVRPGSRLWLSDLFRAWDQPLSTHRVGSFSAPAGGEVAVFVDGRRWLGLPGRVPLVRHAEIVVEAGPHVPPHSSYTFPLGT